MHPDGESLTGQILSAESILTQQAEEKEEAPLTLEEIAARAAPAGYSGPERRAQGYLIAEILPEFPPAGGQEPEPDRRR